MRILPLLLITTALFITTAITAQKKSITAKVINVTSDSGKVGFALFDKDNFMKKPIQAKVSKIENGIATVVFEEVVPGNYAITCYHDKNENGKMDFQANGMPLEDYGASNNTMSFGPPQFENAKFLLSKKDLVLEIRF